VLDIEYNPYGATCYGLSRTQMVAWIKAFTTRYRYRTGRNAVIYTTLDWWTRCTGNSSAFNRTNRMWVARYAATVGSIPGGRPSFTFWQYTSSPLDQNKFNGSYSQLVAVANGAVSVARR
jgi:GH25 family lysozyme M1 (1,4-beta-N-acetylmuramidase)